MKSSFIDDIEKEFAADSADTAAGLRRQLFKKPPHIKHSERTTYKEVAPGTTIQADVLKLPRDGQHAAAVVMTDIYDRKTDAEPIRDMRSQTVLRGALRILGRKIPNVRRGGRIVTDGGPEFSRDFRAHFTEKNVTVVQREAGRHLGPVDRKIKDIGDALLRLQAKDELNTGQTSRRWVDRLPRVIDVINRRNKYNPDNRDKQPQKQPPIKLHSVGTTVRRILYVPRDLLGGKRLHGKFRSADPRWSTSTHKITNVLMYPDAPPMYILSGVKEPVHYKHVQKA